MTGSLSLPLAVLRRESVPKPASSALRILALAGAKYNRFIPYLTYHHITTVSAKRELNSSYEWY